MKYWHETAVKFSRFSTYPKLLMDCGWEATAQSFRLTQQQHPGRFTKSEISCGHESGRPPASESDDLWIVSAAPTQLHLTGLEHVAVIFSLHRAPVRELAGGPGGGVGGGAGGREGLVKSKTNHTAASLCGRMCRRSLFTRWGGKLADSIFNCNVAEKCNCRKSIRAKSKK